jgi:hypothetical protein
MGTRREKETRKTKRDLEKNHREGKIGDGMV